MKFIFGMQINIDVFYKLILSSWVCITRHTQSTQNKNFAYLCNISRKEWGMKLICCLKINTKVFYKLIVSPWVCIAKTCLKRIFAYSRFPQKIQFLNCLLSSLSLSLGLQFARKCIFDTFSDCRSIAFTSFVWSSSNFSWNSEFYKNS